MSGRVRHILTEIPVRYIAGALYSALVLIACGVVGYLDALLLDRKKKESGGLDHLTAVIKTFERPAILRRLLRSIKRFYPDLRVIVVDDSQEPKLISGVEWIQLPFDSGVSAGRKAGLAKVKTPYVLILDDDFVFNHATGLLEAVAEMEKYPEIDIMGGKVVKLPFFTTADYRRAGMYPTKAHSVLLVGSKVGPYQVYDKVPNFYIARTERLRLVDWDPKIKRLDHAEFFTRAKGVLITVLNNKLRCWHANTPFDKHYRQFREDFGNDIQHIRKKYSHLEPF